MIASTRTLPFLTAFRLVAHLEALSWVGLLFGMLLEHGTSTYAELGDRLVFLFGSVHGGLVILYVALAVAVGIGRGWRAGTFAVAVAATLPPFATLVFDRWALRTNRYRRPARSGEDRGRSGAGG